MFGCWSPIAKRLDRIEARIIALDAKVVRLEELVKEVRFIVSRPNPVSSRMVEECGMSIRFVAVLPERPASDDAWAEIASGELTVTIPGAEPIVIATTKDQQLTPSREVEDPRFVAAQSTMVELSFQYIDDAGNLSLLPATAVVELLDTVPPVDPTSVGLRAVEEIPDPPTPEPPPVP